MPLEESELKLDCACGAEDGGTGSLMINATFGNRERKNEGDRETIGVEILG